MPTFTLHCHPDTPCPFIETFNVSVNFRPEGELECIYELRGAIDRLAIPGAGAPLRTNELWRHTCFEVFLRAAGASGYAEFNFSPSSAWAAYRFDKYRTGRSDIELPGPPRIACRQDRATLILKASLMNASHPTQTTQLAVSAVIEDVHGALYYWALRHADGKPDFHHEAAFVAL